MIRYEIGLEFKFDDGTAYQLKCMEHGFGKGKDNTCQVALGTSGGEIWCNRLFTCKTDVSGITLEELEMIMGSFRNHFTGPNYPPPEESDGIVSDEDF